MGGFVDLTGCFGALRLAGRITAVCEEESWNVGFASVLAFGSDFGNVIDTALRIEGLRVGSVVGLALTVAEPPALIVVLRPGWGVAGLTF